MSNVTRYGPFDQDAAKLCQAAMPLPLDERAHAHEWHDKRTDQQGHRRHDRPMADATDRSVKVYPPEIVKRRTVTWDDMSAEIVQAIMREKIEFRFRAPLHLLAVCDQGMRRDGDTFVEGLPRSRLRDVRRKLTFVPAGHEYYEWQEPCVLTRVVYFYFDPAKMPTLRETSVARATLAPRLFFEDATLWNTALKLKRLIESAGSDSSSYIKALGIVLAHEVVRLNEGAPCIEAPVRGGLAAWQQRTVINYIQEHIAEQISLTTLAQLARLSPHYFCRAFKQSFEMPPHRYHCSRRIELAKMLLAKPGSSVTDIALTVGFSDTSSFTAAFGKAAGLTPTAYRRNLT
ncbi:AraC family transcriptional regulator [Rhizobiales bacterium GAS191]|nr:AraC family transcriptional regulator [Rhizobiales bacterium GAS191]